LPHHLLSPDEPVFTVELPWLSVNKNDHPRTEPAVHRIKKDHRDEEGSNSIPTGASIAQRHTNFSHGLSSSPSSRKHDNEILLFFLVCILKILQNKEALKYKYRTKTVLNQQQLLWIGGVYYMERREQHIVLGTSR
jgi:hypothetical protein